IVQAIEMPRIERARRMRAMRKLVLRNNVSRWSAEFLSALRSAGNLTHELDDDDPLGDLEWTIERTRHR
ncbi:MAG TPA: trehalose-6-phosphate synthase, partial [Galbitalea sp.]